MSALAILLISSFLVLLALVGLADAFVHLVCWGARRLAQPRAAGEPVQPAQGITA